MQTVAYFYALDDSEENEVISYHWHPHIGVTTPHVHVRAARHPDLPRFEKAHLPSGRVSIEEVLRLTLDEFGVKSLRPMEWQTILDESQTAFEAWRSWP